MQEWDSTKAKLLARWGIGYQLSDPTRYELDLCFPNEGSNW